MKFLAALVLSLASVAVFAGEHQATTISGTNIDLMMVDHMISGTINGNLVQGSMDEATFTSQLYLRKDGMIIGADFKKSENRMGGIIHHATKDASFTTIMELDRIDQEKSLIVIRANNREIPVTITAEGFANGHFKNPTFTADLGRGQTMTFKINDGQACYGFSTHLIFMIVGAYIH